MARLLLSARCLFSLLLIELSLVIRDYDRAPAVEEALYLLTKSYEKLGMTQSEQRLQPASLS